MFCCHGEDGGKNVFKWSQVTGMHQAKKRVTKTKKTKKVKNVFTKLSKDCRKYLHLV